MLFNGSTNGHLYMTNGEKKMPAKMVQKIRTGNMEVGKWYDLTIKLDKSGSELFITQAGQDRGQLGVDHVEVGDDVHDLVIGVGATRGGELCSQLCPAQRLAAVGVPP